MWRAVPTHHVMYEFRTRPLEDWVLNTLFPENAWQWTTCGAALSRLTVTVSITPSSRSATFSNLTGFNLPQWTWGWNPQQTLTDNNEQHSANLETETLIPLRLNQSRPALTWSYSMDPAQGLRNPLYQSISLTPMSLSCKPPWLPSDFSFPSLSSSTIQIIYWPLTHQKYWSYDQNFRPISRHYCHYWGIVPCENQPDQAEAATWVSTSNYYSTPQSYSTLSTDLAKDKRETKGGRHC